MIGYLRWLLVLWVILVSGFSEAGVTGGCVGWSRDDDRDGRMGIWVEEVRVTGLTDEGGEVTARYQYNAFGELVVKTGSQADANRYRFSTHVWEDVGDLVYYGLRFYQPAMGGWLSRDPIGEAGGVNLYGFVGNDGVNRFDELGMMPILQRLKEVGSRIADKVGNIGTAIAGSFSSPFSTMDESAAAAAEFGIEWGTTEKVAPLLVVAASGAGTEMVVECAGAEVAAAIENWAAEGGLSEDMLEHYEPVPPEKVNLSAAAGRGALYAVAGVKVAQVWARAYSLWTARRAAGLVDELGDAARMIEPLALPYRPKLNLTEVITYNEKSGGSMTALEHIMMRHGHRGSTFGAPAGRFAEGLNSKGVRSLIDEAVASGAYTFRSGNGGGIVFDLKRVIGTDRLGKPATKLQVFFNEAGNITTAYPFN